MLATLFSEFDGCRWRCCLYLMRLICTMQSMVEHAFWGIIHVHVLVCNAATRLVFASEMMMPLAATIRGCEVFFHTFYLTSRPEIFSETRWVRRKHRRKHGMEGRREAGKLLCHLSTLNPLNPKILSFCRCPFFHQILLYCVCTVFCRCGLCLVISGFAEHETKQKCMKTKY